FLCLEPFSAQFARKRSHVVAMNASLVLVQAAQILKLFLAICANDRSILVYSLVCLEFDYGSETFSTLIACKVSDIWVYGMYPLLVQLQSTFLAESFSARVARMFTNLGMHQEVLGEKAFVGTYL